jgi:secretion/DNA translocation related TadE-like protein
MNARNRSPLNERGQATVLTLIFLVVLLGMAALVLDLGSWYRADRDTQSTADAAALAGAQALPNDTAQAASLASSYASKNGGGLDSVSFSSSYGSNDTIKVNVKRPATGIFTRLFGVNSVNVGSKASARTALMSQAQYVAPIVVKNTHPMLNNCGGPCFGPANETTIPVGTTGAPGAFALVNLLNEQSGTSGASVLADWIKNGFNGELPIGSYFSDPGVKFNSNGIQDAMKQRMAINPVLLFPVYDTLTGGGSNAEYHVIGWVGFHVDAIDKSGNNGTVTGYFTTVIWHGIQASSGSNQPPNFGARSVQLVD